MTKSELKKLISECINEVAQEQQGVEEGFFGDVGQFVKDKLPKKGQEFIDNQKQAWNKAKAGSSNQIVAGYAERVANELDKLMARLLKDGNASGIDDVAAKKIMVQGIEIFKKKYNL